MLVYKISQGDITVDCAQLAIGLGIAEGIIVTGIADAWVGMLVGMVAVGNRSGAIGIRN